MKRAWWRGQLLRCSKALPSATSCMLPWYEATHCNTLQHTATNCNTLQHNATQCNALQHTATHCNTLQHNATQCNTLQHTVTRCDMLQHTALHCSTLQHTATRCNTLRVPKALPFATSCMIPSTCAHQQFQVLAFKVFRSFRLQINTFERVGKCGNKSKDFSIPWA